MDFQKLVAGFSGPEKLIAEYIGPVVNYNAPTPAPLNLICNNRLADAGETFWYASALDTDDDEIYTLDTSTGALVQVKRSPVGHAALTFTGLQSKGEYVLVSDILGSKDKSFWARKTAAIIRAADKQEVRAVLTAITNSSAVQTVTQLSGEDLYAVFAKQKQALEDYGTGFVSLVGSAVMNAVDTYDKDNAGTFNYNVTLAQKLAAWGFKLVKIKATAKVKTTGDSVAEPLLATTSLYTVATNSEFADGNPIDFVRRRISPEQAAFMGAEVKDNFRAVVPIQAPVNVAGVDTIGYGVFAVQMNGIAIVNPRAIAKSVSLSL